MTHEPDLNDLTAFVERRLDKVDEHRVTVHLSTCSTCRELVAALAAAVPESKQRRPAVWRRVAPLASVAATIAVAAIIAVLVSQRAPVTDAPPLGAPASPPPAGDPSPPPSTPARTPANAPATTRPTAPPAARPRQGTADARPEGRDLRRRRGAERTVQGKTFRFVAGEWIDTAYDPMRALPIVEIETPGERADLLRRLPELQPFAALGTRVTVVLNGTVYRFQ